MPSWSLAIEGAKRELSQLSGAQKRWRALQIGYFACRELLGTTKLIPFALRSIRARNHVKRGAESNQEDGGGPCLIADLKYGDQPRSNVDVYTPVSDKGKQQSARGLAPVVLFVHGGVWSSGELWHYSTLGKHLASQGVCCVVATYNFYPDVLCSKQIADVSECIGWTMDNISKYGGDAERITLVGHSSGAHLSMMAILARAGIYSSSSSSSSGRSRSSEDVRMPSKVVLMAGVYDISKHFQYEKGRGVHTLSAMSRAMGGETNFGKFSPAVLLLDGNGDHAQTNAAKDLEESEHVVLEGEMLGSMLSSGSPASVIEKVHEDEDFSHIIPPLYLMSGLADHVVPWVWSKEFSEILHARGLEARNLIYCEANHMDFIACWDHGNPSATHQSISGDLLRIIKN